MAKKRVSIGPYKDTALMMLEEMPSEKLEVLKASLDRNFLLTSTYTLEDATLYDLKGQNSKDSGFYLILNGCRSQFSVFMNNDMEFVRKPVKAIEKVKVHFKMNEADFEDVLNTHKTKEFSLNEKVENAKKMSFFNKKEDKIKSL